MVYLKIGCGALQGAKDVGSNPTKRFVACNSTVEYVQGNVAGSTPARPQEVCSSAVERPLKCITHGVDWLRQYIENLYCDAGTFTHP